MKLSQKEFYREMKLRGYDYEGAFKGVLDTNVDGTKSRVSWTNNWVVYIDYIFQTAALRTDTRSLYVPTACTKLSIDTELHYNTLAKIGVSKQPYIGVFIDKNTQVIRSGGLEIRGFKIETFSRRADLRIPIFEKYEFIPNYGKELLTLEKIIHIYVDIIIENIQMHKFKAVEVTDEDYKRKKYIPIIEYVDKVLEATPQVWSELNIITNEKNTYNNNKSIEALPRVTEVSKLYEDKSAVLLIGANLSRKNQILKNCDLCLREGGFLMSREEDAASITKLNDEFDIIATHNTGHEVMVLFKKKIKAEKKLFIKLDTFDHLFSWIAKVKEAIEERNKIVLYAYDELSGVLGLVKCLRKEPGGDDIQCLLITDFDNSSFDPELHIYKGQLDNNLAFNIFTNGQWGTYRHIVMKALDFKSPSPHAYLNIETIGDLSTLKWFVGGFRQNMQGIDENLLFVNVYCSSQNFRDIVTATGRVSVDAMLPGRLEQQCPIGFEFAGRLTNGTRVAGMALQSISNVLLCNKNLIMPIPDEWTFKEAASVMVAYSTVYMAFDVSGKMKPGESVLIHVGSGAVGQAAINVALHRGCKVFTTVGTSEKKDFMKKLYPQLTDNHIGNSRDTSFEQLIMKETNGKGVDLVLNSLSEHKLLASVRCLGRRGRFLEIGKYDVVKNTQIMMSFNKKEISFHSVMLDCFLNNITDGRKLLTLLIKGIANNEIHPLVRCTFEKEEAEAAYRYMATGKHIGKVIIKIREEENETLVKPEPMLIDAHRRYTCSKSYVYILVGGLGGFGLELIDWLVLRGARKLVIVSSRGISTGYQARRIRIWTSYGADIRILMDDVTTESGCKKILASAVEMGHVETIFNLAAVLSDALFQNQSPESFQKSFRVKALATFYLDKHSRDMCRGLRNFVVFSSMACGLGNAGQSNYGLANSVMERICEKRRKDGLPGLAIQWGAIGEVGLFVELQAVISQTAVYGTVPQRITSCLQSLDSIMMQENAVVSIYVLDQKEAIKINKQTSVEAVAKVIGIQNLKTLSYQMSFAELGMDSIMSTEVQQTLERDFDISLTIRELKIMTFAKLLSLTPKQRECDTSVQEKVTKDDWNFDLRYFLSHFGDEENAFKPFIMMPTRSSLIDENVKNKSAKTLFMIPGLEGCAKIFEPLCQRLHIKACVLQLSFDNTYCDLKDMTERLYKVMKQLKGYTSSFNLLGYSYGTIPLLTLAAKLESEGLIGTVFCIDGSPTWFRSVFNNNVGFTDDLKLQDNILKYMFEATLPSDSFITKLEENLTMLPNYDDKIDYIIENSPIDLKYSNTFIKTIFKACNNRLKVLKGFNESVTKKIKSPIVLLRPENSVIRKFAENYELDKFTEAEVTVHYLKGSHVSILKDPNCAIFIEEYLNAE